MSLVVSWLVARMYGGETAGRIELAFIQKLATLSETPIKTNFRSKLHSRPIFQNHGVTTDALNVLCAQLTRDLFAIAKFLVNIMFKNRNK